jgi:hypothetical protein
MVKTWQELCTLRFFYSFYIMTRNDIITQIDLCLQPLNVNKVILLSLAEDDLLAAKTLTREVRPSKSIYGRRRQLT